MFKSLSVDENDYVQQQSIGHIINMEDKKNNSNGIIEEWLSILLSQSMADDDTSGGGGCARQFRMHNLNE